VSGTDIATRESAPMVALSKEQLSFIAGTEFVPPGLRGNLPAILACVATGRAIGIPDMTALRSIHIIDGKPTFSAELMVQLVRRRGHSITGEVTEGAASVTGKRVDNGDTMSATWTLSMAERAGLLNKQNWKRYPEAMLWARAVSQLCRMLFADCFAGATYTTEELGAEHTDSAGDPQAADAASTVAVSQADNEPASPAEQDREFPPVDENGEIIAAGSAETTSQFRVPAAVLPTKKQIDALNALVGKLRRAGHITTEQLYRALDLDPVPGDDGEVHWSPLRDGLTREQASALIERLSALEERVA
jgi:hypothetical protein